MIYTTIAVSHVCLIITTIKGIVLKLASPLNLFQMFKI